MSQISTSDRPKTGHGRRHHGIEAPQTARDSYTPHQRITPDRIEPWTENDQFIDWGTMETNIDITGCDVLDLDTGFELHTNRNRENSSEIDGRPKTSRSMRNRRNSHNQQGEKQHQPMKTARSMSVDINELGDRPKTGRSKERRSYHEPQVNPSPPPHPAPPSTSRTTSAKRRTAKRRTSQENTEANIIFSENPEIRPTSVTLSRYRPLPAIGKSQNLSDDLPEREPPTFERRDDDLIKIHDVQTIENQLADCAITDAEFIERSYSEIALSKTDALFSEPHVLPAEPEGNENRVLLAIKLPNRKRVQRFFRPYEKLKLVLQTAENAMSQDLSDYVLACPMPVIEFKDMNMLIGEAGLQNRTMLHLVLPD
ncbi:uncharacterized protein LOC141908329 isoform X2 [Tubulanus polymorphus]